MTSEGAPRRDVTLGLAPRREPADFDRTSDFRCPTCARQGKTQRNSCKRHEWANASWVAPVARRTAADPSRIKK